jgi:hypothetical protein
MVDKLLPKGPAIAEQYAGFHAVPRRTTALVDEIDLISGQRSLSTSTKEDQRFTAGDRLSPDTSEKLEALGRKLAWGQMDTPTKTYVARRNFTTMFPDLLDESFGP